MSAFARLDGTPSVCGCCGRSTDDLGTCRCVGYPSARQALSRAEQYEEMLRALGQDQQAAELREENAAFRRAIEWMEGDR